MARYLVVSDPPHTPHGLVGIAGAMGLTPAEFRFKANYPVPEVWFADDDPSVVDALADRLRAAGLNVVSMNGGNLARVPVREPVRAFRLEENGLSLELDQGTVRLHSESGFVGVFCQARTQVREHESSVAKDALGARLSHSGFLSPIAKRPSLMERTSPGTVGEPVVFLEIYTQLDGTTRRFALAPEDVDLSALPVPVPTGADAMTVFVAECGRRFPNARIDRRLVGMRPRQPLEVGVEVKALAKRKGFSFATRSLQSLLGSIEPSLEEVSHAELASRLIYLTHRQSGSGETSA